MPFAMYAAIVFTVVLLVANAYFLLGGLPLLVLKHDVPLDASFIRGFFNVYYRVAFWSAILASVSYALWGRFTFSFGAASIAVIAVLLQKRVLPMMQELGGHIQANNAGAIQRFRGLHAVALLIILVQLALLVWGLIQLSRAL